MQIDPINPPLHSGEVLAGLLEAGAHANAQHGAPSRLVARATPPALVAEWEEDKHKVAMAIRFTADGPATEATASLDRASLPMLQRARAWMEAALSFLEVRHVAG